MSYEEDLAYIHHTGFASFVEQATPEIIALLQSAGIEDGMILDLACGSGISSKILIQSGYAVHGIDISPPFINLAQKTASQATFQIESLYNAEFPKVNAVLCISEGLNYLFDENAEQQLKNVFKKIHAALPKNGLFICDIIEPGVNGAVNPSRTFIEGLDWTIHLEKEEYKSGKMERRMTIFRQIAEDSWRRSEETHRVQLYKSTTIAYMLRKAGFAVRIMRGYGDLRFRPGHAGFIARKT